MTHGGKRVGAGRPKNTGKFGQATKVMRVPVGLVEEVNDFVLSKGYNIPLYSSYVPAGFPSPADDDVEQSLDLNRYLIPNPPSSFLVRASGDSMIKAGIFSGDILVVDRSIEPIHGKIVIAVLDGDLTVKRLYKKDNEIRLDAENDSYPHIDIPSLSELTIWGVVTNVIHKT